MRLVVWPGRAAAVRRRLSVGAAAQRHGAAADVRRTQRGAQPDVLGREQDVGRGARLCRPHETQPPRQPSPVRLPHKPVASLRRRPGVPVGVRPQCPRPLPSACRHPTDVGQCRRLCRAGRLPARPARLEVDAGRTVHGG